jgi:subtilisin family serine protease
MLRKRTDTTGRATLSVAGTRVEQLKVQTEPTHWGAYRSNIPIIRNGVIKIGVDRVTLPYKDAVAHFYGGSQFNPNTGVVVGVIDAGVGPNADLNVVGAGMQPLWNYPPSLMIGGVMGRTSPDWIGVSPSPNRGVRGLAPGIAVRSYRVFPQNGAATSWAVLRAILFAEAHDCDILNLSLGFGLPDSLVEVAIRDARDRGMLVIVAVGNNRRGPVTHPAACPGAIAVSALGVVGCFPTGSLCEGEDIRPPHAANPDEFIAGFSNFGPEVAITAPGVGVISTLPHDRYALTAVHPKRRLL